MNPKRAQLLSDGYVILRQVVPPGQLDRLRSDIETVVARQRAGDPEWDRTPQPRASIIDQVDAATIGAFEFLLHREHPWGQRRGAGLPGGGSGLEPGPGHLQSRVQAGRSPAPGTALGDRSPQLAP